MKPRRCDRHADAYKRRVETRRRNWLAKAKHIPVTVPEPEPVTVQIPVRQAHYGRPVLPIAKPEPPAEKAEGFIRRVQLAENMSEADYWQKIGATFRDDYRGGLRLYGYYDLNNEARHILPEALR